MDYDRATERQRAHLEGVIAGKARSTLFLVEHPPVVTLGAAFRAEHLRRSEADLAALGVAVARTDRGGDVTYHGPGQLVAYPVFDVAAFGKDLHRWMRDLEEAVRLALVPFGIEGRRFPPHTGVWVGNRKVCAMGVRVRRWVSMHGLALNVDLDRDPEALIVPCGIRGYGVTSLARELGRKVALDEAKSPLIAGFRAVFD